MAYSAGTQYTRQSLNETQRTWLRRQQGIVCEVMYAVFFIQTLPRILCAVDISCVGFLDLFGPIAGVTNPIM